MPPEPPEGRVRVASMTSARQRVLSDTLLSVSRAYSAPPLSRSHMSWALCSVFRCWHVGFVTAKHRVGCISAGVVAVSGFNLESLSMMNHHQRFESCNRESGAKRAARDSPTLPACTSAHCALAPPVPTGTAWPRAPARSSSPEHERHSQGADHRRHFEPGRKG